jgi:hypothetical protein
LRRIPLSRRSHIVGFQPLPSGLVEHESALERDFVTLTTFSDATLSITSQPVTIYYFDGPTRRRYTPDFLITGAQRPSELIEIKYSEELRRNQERLEAAFTAARAWASERCGTFRVVTELEIRGPHLRNAQRLLPLRHVPLDPERSASVLAATRSQLSPTIGSVLAAVSGDSISLSTLWRLIARGSLRADLSAAISFNTAIFAP